MIPKRTKFRKMRKGRIGRLETKVVGLAFGSYGLQTLESVRLSAAQLEAVRRVLSRRMKRNGQIWFRIFPDRPVSAKPAEVRMGKGKGSTSYWAAYAKAGRMLVEIEGVPQAVALDALEGAKAKFPCLLRIVKRPQVEGE